ncbi:MAG: NAD(P)-dependent alcohol dehydrogenase [Ignavibacteriales bacterium]|jgi:NADPH:quinone reductase-like Zn-dependent oxidoreductase|nr:NAD(P)-dependent alcohol dehydrogenase [Ignavibacteriaceae bacterium]NLH61826.1 NAD(P)-dependent alcohol dehydrogenase [Ignavibacteriales bacterium]
MKAYVCTKYGGPEVLKLTEVAKPSPEKNEVCIKIMATLVTASDIFIRSSQVPLRLKIPMRIIMGITKPRKSIAGLVFAGEIESAGDEIKRFKPGDQVYGLTGFGLGAYAGYKCMKETDSAYGCVAIKPANITYEGAAVAAYGGLLAFQFMEKGNISNDRKVLIYGASGNTGTIAVQYAKYLGAEVTAVCSTANIALVKSLGADNVIDYTKQNELNTGVKYDFVLDAVGKMKRSALKEDCRKAVSPRGKYVSVDDGKLLLDSERLGRIKDIIEAGHIKPVIDRTYTFEEMAEAHRYVSAGHKIGGVVVTAGKD